MLEEITSVSIPERRRQYHKNGLGNDQAAKQTIKKDTL